MVFVAKSLRAERFSTLHLIFFPFGPVAYRILVPWPGMKLVSPAVEAWSLNHWATREFLSPFFKHLIAKFYLRSKQ